MEQIRRVFDDNSMIIFVSSPRRDDSNEYPQHRVLWRNKQIYPLIITKYPSYLFHWSRIAGNESKILPLSIEGPILYISEVDRPEKAINKLVT